MKTIIPNSYQELIERAGEYKNYSLPRVEELLKNLGYKSASHQAQAPVFYIADYIKRKYVYIDPSCKKVLGYEVDFLMEAGPSYFTSLSHKDDFKIFCENILPQTMLFLKDQPLADCSKFSVSFNYRMVIPSGEYITILQRSTYFMSEDKTPLGTIGFIIDITHFKEDTRIIHTIEKIDSNFFTLSRQPLYKEIYYPDRVSGKFNKRELAILQYISEGLSSKQIADRLFLSTNTISDYRKKMLVKTNTKNTSELIHYAILNGLIS
jgi:DNA-binding CsgD family transcriptional regulator